MVQELRHVNIRDLEAGPDWEQLVAQVRTTGKPAILCAGGEDIAELRPLKPKRGRRSPSRALPVTEADPLFRLVGIGRSGKPSNASEHKHEALEEAYRSSHHF